MVIIYLFSKCTPSMPAYQCQSFAKPTQSNRETKRDGPRVKLDPN